MGDVVREETSARGLELTPANVGKVMLELRKIGGDTIIAEKCVPKILQKPNPKIIIDGLRSYVEAQVFSRSFANFVLVTVHVCDQDAVERAFVRAEAMTPKLGNFP
jgi:dephospho-CoA kinase